MIARFVHKGDSIDFLPTTALARGVIVVIGLLIGVAIHGAEAGKTATLALTGVFDVSKAVGPGTAIAMGTVVYWDATNEVATGDDGGGANARLGIAVSDGGDDFASVRVHINR